MSCAIIAIRRAIVLVIVLLVRKNAVAKLEGVVVVITNENQVEEVEAGAAAGEGVDRVVGQATCGGQQVVVPCRSHRFCYENFVGSFHQNESINETDSYTCPKMVKKITLSKTAAKRIAAAAKSKPKSKPGRNVPMRRKPVRTGRVRTVRQRNGRTTKVGGNVGKLNYVTAPVNIGHVASNVGPGARFKMKTVEGREYLGDVTGATTITPGPGIYWNAGDGTVFPWLSKIASAFSMHKWRKLIVEYRPTSSSAQTGDVLFATMSDINIPTLTTKQQFLDQGFSNQAVPWLGFKHDVLKSGGTRYLNEMFNADASGTLPADLSNDEHFYYPCFSQIAVTGNTGSVVIGELWVEYSVDFIEPRIAPLLSSIPDIPDSVPQINDAMVWYNTIGIASSVPLGTLGSQGYTASRYFGPRTGLGNDSVWGIFSGGQTLVYQGGSDPNANYSRFFRVTYVLVGTGFTGHRSALYSLSNMAFASLLITNANNATTTGAISTSIIEFPADFQNGAVPSCNIVIPVTGFTLLTGVMFEITELPFYPAVYTLFNEQKERGKVKHPGRNSKVWREAHKPKLLPTTDQKQRYLQEAITRSSNVVETKRLSQVTMQKPSS